MKVPYFVLASLLSLLATQSGFAADSSAAQSLTPPAPPTPRVNGPSVFGVRPGSIFLYAIPATGSRPMEFSADNLPQGLKVEKSTGQITGSVSQKGEYIVILRVKNSLGSAQKKFRIEVGDHLALTPPMGWSSWNCWGGQVSQQNVLNCAQAMVAKGLAQHGWTYMNIDDGWQGTRGGKYDAIQPNSKFPDMKGLADQIHELGLKLGIYSTPWRGSYEGHVGGSSDNADGTYNWVASGDHNEFFRFGKDPKTQGKVKQQNWVMGKYPFATKDAQQWADWGIDYLKYDWNPVDPPHVEEMTKALLNNSRDIVYSLSNSGSFNYAADYVRLSNVWRTTGDIRDNWKRMTELGFSQDQWAPFTGPGHWADPDMLVVGMVGGWSNKLHPTRLTPDEQYTHISLWCLLSAPLLMGCDVSQLDDFTLGLLTNDEVLAIDQDPLGKQATQVSNDNGKIVYGKTLEDGSVAVGLFNSTEAPAAIEVSGPTWKMVKPSADGKLLVRDLWRQKDIGQFTDKFEANVAPHGVVLVRLITPN